MTNSNNQGKKIPKNTKKKVEWNFRNAIFILKTKAQTIYNDLRTLLNISKLVVVGIDICLS